MYSTSAATVADGNRSHAHSTRSSKTHDDKIGPSRVCSSNKRSRWDQDRRRFAARTPAGMADEWSNSGSEECLVREDARAVGPARFRCNAWLRGREHRIPAPGARGNTGATSHARADGAENSRCKLDQLAGPRSRAAARARQRRASIAATRASTAAARKNSRRLRDISLRNRSPEKLSPQQNRSDASMLKRWIKPGRRDLTPVCSSLNYHPLSARSSTG